MVDKSIQLKLYTNGEILTAEDLNTSIQGVGAVQYLAPYNASLSKDSAGVVFLGTTQYAFAGIVLKAGYKLLQSDGVNTTEITLSGGGAGAGLVSIEMKSHQVKEGLDYPISEQNYLSETYTDTNVGFMRLGKSYGTGDGNLIYLHNDYMSVSKCNALSDGTGTWSALGAQAGAASVGGTHSIESGSAIYTTVAATTGENGLRFKIGANSISLSDRKLRYAVYLSTVSNINSIKTIAAISSGTANSAYWDLTTQASGSPLIGGWNFMEVNMASTSSGSSGSFSAAATREVHIKITPASSQSFVMAVDDVCHVDDRELVLPDIWQIADANNTQLLFINSGKNGAYAAGTTILNNYAIETTDIKKKFGTVASGQRYFPSGSGVVVYSGALAKEIWSIQSKKLPKTLSNKTIEISNRVYTPEFEIIDVPNANSLKLRTVFGTGDYLSLVAGDTMNVYSREWNGMSYENPEVSAFSGNYKTLTISGSTTVSGEEITVNHSESNSGVDANGKFFIINNIEDVYAKLEDSSANGSLTKLTPTIFISKDQGIPYPPYIHSHWKLNKTSGNEPNYKAAGGAYDLSMVGTVPSTTGKLTLARGPFTGANYLLWNSGGLGTTIYDTKTYFFECWFKTAGAGVNQVIAHKRSGATGWGVQFNTSNKVILYQETNPEYLVSVASLNDGLWHHVFVGVRATSGAGEARMYIDGSVTATAAGATYTGNASNLLIGIDNAAAFPFLGQLASIAYWNTVPSTWGEVETYISKRYALGVGREYGNDVGFYYRGSLTNQTGNKLVIAKKMTRQDTTNQIFGASLQSDGLVS